MERNTMSPKIFSGYTNPYPKNMKKVLWTENINGQESFVKSWIEYRKKYKCKDRMFVVC